MRVGDNIFQKDVGGIELALDLLHGDGFVCPRLENADFGCDPAGLFNEKDLVSNPPHFVRGACTGEFQTKISDPSLVLLGLRWSDGTGHEEVSCYAPSDLLDDSVGFRRIPKMVSHQSEVLRIQFAGCSDQCGLFQDAG